MKMNVCYTLNETDIRNIIATHFKVDYKDVNLKMSQVYKGYGTNEYKDLIIECSVNIDEQRYRDLHKKTY